MKAGIVPGAILIMALSAACPNPYYELGWKAGETEIEIEDVTPADGAVTADTTPLLGCAVV